MAPQNITQKRIVIDSGNRLRTSSSDMSRLAVSSEGIPVNISENVAKPQTNKYKRFFIEIFSKKIWESG